MRSGSRWNLFEQLEHHPEMTSWHHTLTHPRWASVPGQATPGEAAFFIVENMITAGCAQALDSCQLSYFLKLEPWNSWLWMLSAIPAEFLHIKQSREIKIGLRGHDSLFPLHSRAPITPRPLHFTRVIYYPNMLRFLFALFALLPPRRPVGPAGVIFIRSSEESWADKLMTCECGKANE